MGIFKNISTRAPKKSKFDLSHTKKLSMSMGPLYPMLLQEIVPGDSFKVNSEVMLRLAPMIAPVMHRVNVYVHYFFVPNRIVWDEWEDFVTGGEDGLSAPIFPTIAMNDAVKADFDKGTLADYFGLPLPDQAAPILNDIQISALPFRGYQTIFNEYYRDQNLEEKIVVPKSSGSGSNAEARIAATMRTRAWEKDYFTSALPWAQRGGEATLPTDINYKDQSDVVATSGNPIADLSNLAAAATTGGLIGEGTPGPGAVRIENIDDIGVNINELRRATKLQVWLEKSARGGSRYIEQILSHFGVRSSDARLQRPEYLGGGKQPVVISEVLQTSPTADDLFPTPQGNMSGHGISVGSTNNFKRSFEEHGYVIGIISVIPKTAYQQGLERHWRKFDKFDLYWPEFAHLGEQEITASEIYSDFTDDTALSRVWGYQQRYAEYKYQSSTVHGDFRDNLAFWQMARIFDSEPALNSNFVRADDITKRIFAVTDPTIDSLYVQIYNKVSALRPMPYFSIPEL